MTHSGLMRWFNILSNSWERRGEGVRSNAESQRRPYKHRSTAGCRWTRRENVQKRLPETCKSQGLNRGIQQSLMERSQPTKLDLTVIARGMKNIPGFRKQREPARSGCATKVAEVKRSGKHGPRVTLLVWEMGTMAPAPLDMICITCTDAEPGAKHIFLQVGRSHHCSFHLDSG